MRPQQSIWGHIMVLVVWATGFYSLILSPYQLDDLSKGAIIGFMGLALQWEFGTAIAAATSRQQDRAVQQGQNQSPQPPSAPYDAGENPSTAPEKGNVG